MLSAGSSKTIIDGVDRGAVDIVDCCTVEVDREAPEVDASAVQVGKDGIVVEGGGMEEVGPGATDEEYHATEVEGCVVDVEGAAAEVKGGIVAVDTCWPSCKANSASNSSIAWFMPSSIPPDSSSNST